jgi:AraC family transcriptional regulator of arabinose operon
MDYRVQQAIALMRDGPHQKLSVASLARAVGLSTSRFQHLFKADTGASPAQYLQRCRMEHARMLLETSCLTIEQILLRTGVGDRSHFEREFKKRYRLTPTRYRAASHQCRVAPLVEEFTVE